MATTYKTPGVYVEEISKFPPSIAEVDTAVPAFIGYTEKANKNGEDLKNKPTKIKSMLEYETYFGEGTPFKIEGADGTSVSNGAANVTITPKYYLYDSLQLYFANGGGDCFIVSIGDYESDPDKDHFMGFDNNSTPATPKGIDALKLYDEPTILLFPDAVLLNDYTKLKDVQQAALKQCGELMDRVTILDILKEDIEGSDFRNAIGMTSLKYGAAYTPWLKASLTKKITLSQFKVNDGVSIFKMLEEKTDSESIIEQIGHYEDFLEKIALDVENDPAPAVAASFTGQVGGMNEDVTITADNPGIDGDDITLIFDGIKTINEVLNVWNDSNPDNTASIDGDGDGDQTPDDDTTINLTGGKDKIFSHEEISAKIDSYEQTLIDNIPFYANLLKAIQAKATELPPSGAIAGIYCSVDNSRGVWKAPANVSLSYVNGVTQLFTASELDALNIDVNAGKSINVIRPITGMGTMVMGARTLAGNDNEWRYIPVRRFFNFVEESCKKSTHWAVFEPNDANLWLKVRTMIETFLYNLWRRGALAGAKPEHAYYVSCGLNVTMTADDIFNGRLIIEVGMAAVRPAEFIVLRFSHKMQES